MKKWLLNMAIWLDQGVNTFIGGSPDESLSARAWRTKNPVYKVIDRLVFWQVDHCKKSYQSEVERKQMPTEYWA